VLWRSLLTDVWLLQKINLKLVKRFFNKGFMLFDSKKCTSLSQEQKQLFLEPPNLQKQ